MLIAFGGYREYEIISPNGHKFMVLIKYVGSDPNHDKMINELISVQLTKYKYDDFDILYPPLYHRTCLDYAN